jgi:hypothetical protein
MGDNVPAEFVGKARFFRASMHAATAPVGPQMRAVSQYSFDLYRRRNAAPRPEQLVAIEQRWRSICGAGCLRLSICRDKRSMLIQDTRIVTTVSSNIAWGGASEKSICLIESSLALTKRNAETAATMLAAISLHALGRWYQRAFITDDITLMLDLALVVAAAPGLVARASDVEVNSENGGCWRGMVVDTRDGGTLVNIRTFV